MKKSMRRLLIGALFLTGVVSGAPAADFDVGISQDFFDRAIRDAKIPIVPVDSDYHCDPNLLTVDSSITAADLLEAARQPDAGPWAVEIETWTREMNDQISSAEQNRKGVIENGKKWEGPSESELEEYKKLKFPITACITHLRVTLDKRPGITIAPPGADVSIPDISAHAKVQVYVYNPFHQCTHQICIGGWCFCTAWRGGWDPLGGGFDLGTDHAKAAGTLTPRVSAPIVFLDPTIKRLRFAPPWDWIPLEDVANQLVKPIQALDLRSISIPIDLLGEHYIGDTAKVTVTARKIDMGVTLKKVP